MIQRAGSVEGGKDKPFLSYAEHEPYADDKADKCPRNRSPVVNTSTKRPQGAACALQKIHPTPVPHAQALANHRSCRT